MTFANAKASSSASEGDFPLHLALSYILVRAYPQTPVHQTTFAYSHAFVASILALVAQEELELRDAPATFAELSRELDQIVRPETEEIRRMNDKLRSRGQAISADREAAEQYENWMSTFAMNFGNIPDGCSFIDYLEKEIRDRVNELGDDEVTETPHPIERRSPLGLFLRRVTTRLRKLSFSETGHLAVQVGQWCGNEVVRGGLSAAISRRTAMENTSQTRQETMESINRATEAGDYTSALSSLRRFYDYQFPSAGRGRHQHALLNIASFHYSTDGLELAQKAVDEAIRVARAEGDKACLTACISLSNRIQSGLGDKATHGRFIVEDRPMVDASLPLPHDPIEELWTLQVALRRGEPAHIALRRVQLSLARYEGMRMKMEDKNTHGYASEQAFDQAAWHGSQAALWAMMGSNTLAALHEDMAMESEGHRINVQLAHVIAKAQRLAERGSFDEALSSLLDFVVLDGTSHAAFKRWAACVWSVLRQQIIFSGNGHALNVLDTLQPQPDVGVKIAVDTVPDEIRASLKQTEKLRDANAPHLVLPRVLSSIHLARDLGLWTLYRLSIVMFAETLLAMEDQGMSRTAIEEVEKIWPELSGSGDEGTLARAALVLGKALISISLDEGHPDLLEHALAHLRTAQQSAERVSARRMLLEVRELMKGITELRGSTDRHRIATERAVQSNDLEERVRSVGEIVKQASVRVSENWA